MSYYQGDFYGGSGYYTGDPGFLSFLGKIGKGIVNVAKGQLGIAPSVKMAMPAVAAPAIAATTAIIRRAGGAIESGGMAAVKTIARHPVISAAAGAGVIGAMTGGAALVHRARAAHMAGGRRHRRMNVCNQRALRRSLRRAHGFAKLAMRTLHLVYPKKHARFGGFKKKRAHAHA